MKASNPSYPLSLSMRVDWSEIDLFGHVNNTAFFKYMQSSRMHLFEELGFAQHVQPKGIGPILASAQCQFYKPLFYPGNIEIKARVTFVKNTSFGLEHLILNDAGEETALGQDVIVIYDFGEGIKHPIPEAIRSQLDFYK